MITRRILMLLCAVALLMPVSGMAQDDGGGKKKKKPVRTEQTSDAEARRQQQEAEARRQRETEVQRQREEEAKRKREEEIMRQQAAKTVETFTVNGVSFDMVRVDGGTYSMGSYSGDSDEQPVHSETVGTFYIGKTEVTQRLWSAVMGSNPSRFKGDNMPVENVSWDDCQEFVDRLSRITGKTFRLPTEAEWEYAARGGSKSRGYTYSGSNDVGRVAWYGENSGKTTHPVAQKLDNELGLFDMSGNVWEWCSDNWSDNYSSSPNSSYRVYRGGSWSSTASNCRVAYRGSRSPGYRYGNLGLRLAL